MPRYTNVVERGKNVLTRHTWGPTRFFRWLAGCMGRVQHGEVYIPEATRDLAF